MAHTTVHYYQSLRALYFSLFGNNQICQPSTEKIKHTRLHFLLFLSAFIFVKFWKITSVYFSSHIKHSPAACWAKYSLQGIRWVGRSQGWFTLSPVRLEPRETVEHLVPEPAAPFEWPWELHAMVWPLWEFHELYWHMEWVHADAWCFSDGGWDHSIVKALHSLQLPLDLLGYMDGFI